MTYLAFSTSTICIYNNYNNQDKLTINTDKDKAFKPSFENKHGMAQHIDVEQPKSPKRMNSSHESESKPQWQVSLSPITCPRKCTLGSSCLTNTSTRTSKVRRAQRTWHSAQTVGPVLCVAHASNASPSSAANTYRVARIVQDASEEWAAQRALCVTGARVADQHSLARLAEHAAAGNWLVAGRRCTVTKWSAEPVGYDDRLLYG